MKSKLLTFCTATFLALFSFIPLTHASDNLMGVIFYADWCGSCKILTPRIDEARKDKNLDDIKFVVFDMTDGPSIANTKKKAESLGLNDLLQTYGAVTGFMVIYDQDKKETIQTITTANTAPEIVSAFKTASKE